MLSKFQDKYIVLRKAKENSYTACMRIIPIYI